MKFLIPLVFLSFSFVALPGQLEAAVGDVNYISDVLKVPMRSGPSSGHRIIHQGLPSGTHLTVLAIDEEAGFTQVKTLKGMEGWVRSQYLIVQPIARVKLAAAEKRLQSLNAKIEKERQELANIQSKHKEIEGTNTTLNSQVEALTKELTELKVVAANPVKEHTRNVELTQQNTLLVGQVEELSSKNRQLESNVQLKWLLYGGALVLIGLIFGLVLKKRPKQQASFSRYS